MLTRKLNSLLAIMLFLSIGCEEPIKVEDAETPDRNTLNDANLGNNDIGQIEDYWYNAEEGIEARFLYHNVYVTSGSNTISNPSGLNPYLDTLNFRTFPKYNVEIDGAQKTFGYMLSLTPENIDNFSTLYPLDETNPNALNWCNEMLVEYEGDCPDASVEVNFDYSLLLSSITGREADTVISPATFNSLVSKKEVIHETSWKNIESIVWDNTLNRYSFTTDSSAHVMKATMCAGICDTSKTDSTAGACSDTLYTTKLTCDDASGTWTSFYDSTFVIYNISDVFDSLIYVGIIDVERQPVTDQIFVDRTEWEKFDTTYQSSLYEYHLDTTFIYNKIELPKDSPIYRVNSDCNQNLIRDLAETYYDYGKDWCPDSLETGEGECTVVDEDGDGDLSNEGPCNCQETISAAYIPGFCSDSEYTDEITCEDAGVCSGTQYTTKSTCTALTNGICSNTSITAEEDCISDPAQCSDGISTTIADCCEADSGIWSANSWTPQIYVWIPNNKWNPPNDPNGDRWRDCGWDGICPNDLDYETADFNGTELNGIWDLYERSEGNGQYDFDSNTKTGERFDDEFNSIADEPAEYCIKGNDGVCDINDTFEDRNCNGKWDDQEFGNKGNGIWDDDELFTDTGEMNGSWESGEPLYVISNVPATILVDYTDPANPQHVASIDTTTSVTLLYGTYGSSSTSEDSVHIRFNRLLIDQEIEDIHQQGFYNIASKKTIYTNKIMENPVPGNVDDYYITKTRWFQDIERTSFDEDDLDDPEYGDNYGYDYHIFKTADNGDIMKMVHPAYFNYYGYYNSFDAFQLGTWSEETLEEEIYIHTYGGKYLRSGESIYRDTTIVTDVADYYVENEYEVSFDTSVVIPFKKVKYSLQGNDTLCLNTSDMGYAVEPPWVSIDIEDNYMQNCPPYDTTLTNTFKITRTKTITMIGTGLELGLRNTTWLGSEGENKPLGIVMDQYETRWSEPYWETFGSSWAVTARIELSSLHKIEPETSSLLRIFQPIKRLSLNKLVNEENFNNEPYVFKPLYGIHRLRLPNER